LFGSSFQRKIGGGGSGGIGIEGGSTNHKIALYSLHGGVVGPALPPSRDVLWRGKRGGSSLSGGADGGEGHNNGPVGGADANRANKEEEGRRRRRDFESELKRQRRADHERQQLAECRWAEEERSAAAARLGVEAERLCRAEEEERTERQCLEAERCRAPCKKVRSALDRLTALARTATDDVAHLRKAHAALVERRATAEKAKRYTAQWAKFVEVQQSVVIEEEDFEPMEGGRGVVPPQYCGGN
jgi:hypothetical protein